MPRKSTKKPYFDVEQEQAVIDYIKSDSKEEKDYIYNTYLKDALRIMTESILRRYTTQIGNHTMEEVEHAALTHVIDKMVIYDPNRIMKSGQPAKAYSYLQTIIRNYYREHSKKSTNEKKNILDIDDHYEDIHKNDMYLTEIEIDEDIPNPWISNLIFEIKEKIASFPKNKKNEIAVGEALIQIIENAETLFAEDSPDGIYQKKVTDAYKKSKVILYIMEITNLSKDEFNKAFKPYRQMYRLKKTSLFND